MAKARLALMLDRTGVTSVAILADDHQGREKVLELYAAIRAKVDVFDQQVRECFTQGNAEGDLT